MAKRAGQATPRHPLLTLPAYPFPMRRLAASLFVVALSACSSAPREAAPTPGLASFSGGLPDRVAFLQKDPRWGGDELGRSGDTMASDGCLVTAVAMALANLGIDTDPGELNRDLTRSDGFTPRGWLKWSAVADVTNGRARALYHDAVSPELIRSCIADGDYPLVRFYLPNGRSHWALVVAESPQGYRMRDPLRPSRSPLIFPRGADAFKSLRCVGEA